MNTASILNELRSERDRIQKAIDAIEALDSAASPARATQQSAPKPRGRRMSPAARKRMSEMMKNRWAQKKKAAKPPTKKTTQARHMSAATKRKLSEAAKQRWAEQKKAAKA